ncbi:MAG: glucosaminidase domain-containing protein, partial [Propionibacteriaceae bacterium]
MTTSITRTIRRSLASLLATATLVVGYLVITTPMATSAAHADYRNDYIAAHISDAQAVERAFGVPASVALAQSILESGWGQSGLAVNDNNYFGIKCFGGVITSPYTDSCSDWPTKEYYNGWVTVYAKFRHYNSPQRSFEDYGNFLNVNSRYANAFNYSNDADQFIREVHAAGYATDPGYSSSV